MNRLLAARVTWLAALFLALPLAGCKDDRESEIGPSPGFLDGDGLYGTAVISAAILRYHNAMAEEVLDIVLNNRGTPIIEPGCDGSGTRTFLRDPLNANRITVRHLNVTFECGEFTAVTLTEGEMIIEVLETSPGLHYTVSVPLDQLSGDATTAMRYEYSGDIGVRVTVSTPGKLVNPQDPFGLTPYLDYVLGSDGRVSALGILRLEERSSGILVVQELDLSYPYDAQSVPAFSPWASGSYETAAISPPGFFQAPVASIPVGVTLDGFGGATFDYAGRVCATNMATGENPCENL